MTTTVQDTRDIPAAATLVPDPLWGDPLSPAVVSIVELIRPAGAGRGPDGAPMTAVETILVPAVGDYLAMIDHPRSVAGFHSDFDAMRWADVCVLVLPCGKSAHLELGWAVGAGKRTAILLEDPVEPELMYRMVDYLATGLDGLTQWLGGVL